MTVINREQTTFQKCESPSGLFDKLRVDEPRGVVVQRGLAPATIVVAPDPGETVVIDPKLGTVLKFAFSLADANIEPTTNGLRIELPNGGTVILKNMSLLEAVPVLATQNGTVDPQICTTDVGQIVQILDRTGSGFRSQQHAPTEMVLPTLIAHGVLGGTALDYHVFDPVVTFRPMMGADLAATSNGLSAADDALTLTEDGPIAGGNVLTNDSSASGSPMTVALINGSAANIGFPVASAHGWLTLNTDGTYSYEVNNADADGQALGVGESFTDIFSYTITDADGNTSTATLTITITGTNDGPVANADSNTVAEGTAAPVTGNVLTNDTDVDGDTLTVTTTGAQTGSYGTVTINANGGYSYNLDNSNPAVQALGVGETATEVFSYSISDGNGGTSISTLTITITGTNDAPVANADVNTIAEDTVPPISGNVLTNDSDVEGDALSVTTTGAQTGSYGTVTIAADGTYSYTLDNSNPAVQGLAVGETVTETFSYSISDGNGGTATST